MSYYYYYYEWLEQWRRDPGLPLLPGSTSTAHSAPAHVLFHFIKSLGLLLINILIFSYFISLCSTVCLHHFANPTYTVDLFDIDSHGHLCDLSSFPCSCNAKLQTTSFEFLQMYHKCPHDLIDELMRFKYFSILYALGSILVLFHNLLFKIIVKWQVLCAFFLYFDGDTIVHFVYR